MKTLLFLNGPAGFQKGIEDGFSELHEKGKIKNVKWFYHDAQLKEHHASVVKQKMLDVASTYQPELIIFFHIGSFPLTAEWIDKFKQLNSKPILAYDEGDMYGGWSKTMTNTMEVLMSSSDVVSIRGLGKWYRKVKNINKNTIYVPHCNSLHRYTKNLKLPANRERKINLVGNRVQSKLKFLRRLPGASGRENLVKRFRKYFGTSFKLYGRGWEESSNYLGILEFEKQAKVYRNNWFHLAYEHYPDIPFYFSDRLPIALSCGQIYLCHYHKGYEDIFKNVDFIYFFKSFEEAVDLYNYLKSLSDKRLYQKSLNAKQWADNNLSPAIVWGNFIRHVKDEIVGKRN